MTDKSFNGSVTVSMNGLRSNLSQDVAELKELVQQVLNDDYVDKDDLTDAMNNIICASNGLNFISIEGDDSFVEMGETSVEVIE